MEVFKSRVEGLLPVRELDFEPTPSFGKYKEFFPDEAVSHPAKANTNLLEYLVKRYTEPGDLVLDPMAGTYSTCVVACLHGRNAIGVDIEEKFYKWGLEAKERLEKTGTLTPKGKMVVLKGDARKLSKLLKEHEREIATIITSPPYAGVSSYKLDEKFWRKGKEMGLRWGSKTPSPFSVKYEDPRNIGNLPYGNVDVVITSPPYGETYRHDRRAENPEAIEKMADMLSVKSGDHHTEGRMRRIQRDYEGYSGNPENIGNLSYGNVDAIITSPPYSGANLSGGDVEKRMKRLAEKGYNPKDYLGGRARNTVLQHYSTSKNNIGNIPYGNVDTIITSPPYEGSLEGTSRHTRGGIASRDPKLAQTGTYALLENASNEDLDEMIKRLRMHGRSNPKAGGPFGRSLAHSYSYNPDNIGNMKKETYIEAMLRVYRECWKVMKPNGKILVIVKPFIRKKRVVDLPYHTMLMLERVGFKVVEALKYKLKTKSFWRILYERRFPQVPRIEHEYVLVGVKNP